MADASDETHEEGRETLRLIDEFPFARRTVLRMALLYAPVTLLSGGLAIVALYNVLIGSFAAIVGAFLLGTIAFATGYQALTALRDLRSRPVITRGTIDRAWDKGTVLWMSRTYYVLVSNPRADDPERRERDVFVVPQTAYLELAERMRIEVEHWPHTNTVIRVSVIERERRSGRADRRGGRPTRQS